MSTVSIAPVILPDTARSARPVRPVVSIRPAAVALSTAAARPTGPVRLTRRGRVVVLFSFLVVLVLLMTVLGGWATATLQGGTHEPVKVIQVRPGDSLYSIAGDAAKPGQVREMVQRIEDLNSLPGADIQVGQQLAIPQS